MSESPAPPSYEELVALVSVLSGQLAEQSRLLGEQSKLIESLRVEFAALGRKAGRDSSNSSQPPSQDGPGSKAKVKASNGSGEPADASSDGPSKPAEPGTRKRRRGGRSGHRGSGLARVARADRTEKVEPPACGGCGASLAEVEGKVAWSVQVFDLPALALQVTEYLIMRRVCGCGCATTAALPAGVRGGPTCYGPLVSAAVTWLASQDVIGIERAADMMCAVLGAPVSTGFVSGCLTRLDGALARAGFEDALKAALCEQSVLGTGSAWMPPRTTTPTALAP